MPTPLSVPPTTAPAVLRQLFEALKESPGSLHSTVYLGERADMDRLRIVLTGHVEWNKTDWATLGGGGLRREEDYYLQGVVSVSLAGDTIAEALASAFETYALVETVVVGMARSNSSSFVLDQGTITNLEVLPQHGGPSETTEGAAYELPFRIRVQARI